VETCNDSWRFKAATTITHPELAPSPQPRPALAQTPNATIHSATG
jgi:hypothetical protein